MSSVIEAIPEASSTPAITIDQLDQITSLEALSEWATHCTACALRSEASQVVHSSGPSTSPVMIVGMNPGFMEDGTGIPFCGRAELLRSRCISCQHYAQCYDWQTGQGASRPLVQRCLGYTPATPGTLPTLPPLTVKAGAFEIGGVRSAGQIFDEALLALGIDREKLFVTNSALCKTTSGDPKPQYVNRCASIRLRTQRLLQPKIVIALGRLAIRQYSGKQLTLKTSHGVPFIYEDDQQRLTVIPTYHPASILRKMLASSNLPAEMLTQVQRDVAGEKWALYEDLGAAFNLLAPADLQALLLPTAALEGNQLVLRRRSR